MSNEIRRDIKIIIDMACNIQGLQAYQLNAISNLLTLVDLFLKVSEGGGVEKRERIKVNTDIMAGCPYCQRELEYCNCYKVFNEALDFSNAHWTGKLMGLEDKIYPFIKHLFKWECIPSSYDIKHECKSIAQAIAQSIITELTGK